MSEGLPFIFRGLIIGFSIAAPVGPIGILCIRRTLANGRFSGFVSGLGAATADAVYGSVAALGLTFITTLLVAQDTWLRLIGGIFLCYLGIKTFFEKPGKINQPLDLPSGDIRLAQSSKARAADYFSTFLLTLTNPVTILSFAAVFSGLGIAEMDGSPLGSLALVLGVFMGSVLWWLLLTLGADLLRDRFMTPNGLRIVNWISGLIILGFGIAALGSILIT